MSFDVLTISIVSNLDESDGISTIPSRKPRAA
jgi:hypothetical protein